MSPIIDHQTAKDFANLESELAATKGALAEARRHNSALEDQSLGFFGLRIGALEAELAAERKRADEAAEFFLQTNEALQRLGEQYGCTAGSNRIDWLKEHLSNSAARVAKLEAGLRDVCQRANESRTGNSGLLETIHAMHGIARAALVQECGEAMSLTFKPKDQQVRLIFTNGPGSAMPEHKGKVFALIGPFECFTDKADLQDMLETLLRGYNLEPSHD